LQEIAVFRGERGMDQPTDIESANNLIQSGRKKEARELLRKILAIDNRNERAWMLFADASEKKEHEIECLKNVLKINPNNEDAKQKLFFRTTSVSQDNPPLQFSNELRRAPYCKENVKEDVIVCAHCGRDISTANYRMNRFIRVYIQNLIILTIIIIIVYVVGNILTGGFMGLVFQAYWLLLGPLGLIALAIFALPRRR
jgi:tetratricopeptide (TPR) repeat protein